MRKKLLIPLFFLLCIFSFSTHTFGYEKSYSVIVQRKAGINLMRKYFFLLKKIKPQFVLPNVSNPFSYHLPNYQQVPLGLHPAIHKNIKVKKFIVIRDLRDATVSAVYYLEKHRKQNQKFPLWKEKPFEDDEFFNFNIFMYCWMET